MFCDQSGNFRAWSAGAAGFLDNQRPTGFADAGEDRFTVEWLQAEQINDLDIEAGAQSRLLDDQANWSHRGIG